LLTRLAGGCSLSILRTCSPGSHPFHP
jgi:hypothetical protein